MDPIQPLNFVAIDPLHVVPLLIAFVLGLGARMLGLPPLIGFLCAGFVLAHLGMSHSLLLQEIADLGVTLLLFTIGLKLQLRDLIAPVVWFSGLAHALTITLLGALLVSLLGALGLALLADLQFQTALLVGFALSASSTVFAVKVFEARGEMGSLHARVAVGVLIMQDLVAVSFIAIAAGKMPSVWSLLLFALIPLRPLLLLLLERVGHGELLVLVGWLLPLLGAGLFEAVGIKADLGALALGLLLSGHPKSAELAKSLFSFKDLFLIGFFVSIGLAGELSWFTFGVALLLLALLVPIKTGLYFLFLTRLRMRARGAALASLGLANFSEFGLIVGAIATQHGWLAPRWLSVFALALALSFVLAAPLNARALQIYERWAKWLRRFQQRRRLAGDELIRPGDARVLVFGMGRVGSGAYDYLTQHWGDVVMGIDIDPGTVQRHREAGRNVAHGDATDPDFWARAERGGHLCLALLAFPEHQANLMAARLLHDHGYDVPLASVAHYPDDEQALRDAGVSAVFNYYAGAGKGFAELASAQFEVALNGSASSARPPIDS